MELVSRAVPEGLAVWWWSALAAGLVVAIVLVALLHTLFRLVSHIQRGVEAVWESGKQLARNTATTWMLQQTSRLVRDIEREAAEHDRLLSGGSV